MNCQMILVISSPSSSTTGFFTLIFAMRCPCLGAAAMLVRRASKRASLGLKVPGSRPNTRRPCWSCRTEQEARSASSSSKTTRAPPCSHASSAPPATRRSGPPARPPCFDVLLDRWEPDLVVLDLELPDIDGFALLERVVKAGVPALVLTADDSPTTRRRALGLGARDFVTKPLDRVEVLLRVGNLLQTRRLQRALEDRNHDLQRWVRARTADLEDARKETLERLALAAEYRDDDTHQHTKRVGRTAALLARQLGLAADTVEHLRHAAPLHDVGKIGIPDAVWLKPGALTDHERKMLEEHTEIGGRILSGSRSPILRLAEQIARTHHERWDGTGYPRRPRGRRDPARRAASPPSPTSSTCSPTRARTRRRGRSSRRSQEILDQAGRQFDPEVVAAFRRLDAPARCSSRSTTSCRCAASPSVAEAPSLRGRWRVARPMAARRSLARAPFYAPTRSPTRSRRCRTSTSSRPTSRSSRRSSARARGWAREQCAEVGRAWGGEPLRWGFAGQRAPAEAAHARPLRQPHRRGRVPPGLPPAHDARLVAGAALAAVDVRPRGRARRARGDGPDERPGRGRPRLPDDDDLRGDPRAAPHARAARRVGAAAQRRRLRPRAAAPARRRPSAAWR